MFSFLLVAVTFLGLILAAPVENISATATTYTVRTGDTLYDIANAVGGGTQVTWEQLAEWNNLTESPSSIFPGQVLKLTCEYHIVQSGDTLYDIANSVGGGTQVTWEQLAEWNNLTENPSSIFPGQVLRLTPPPTSSF